jgi:membrane protein insertase Oxa1/YidC/SpoIIIJ
MDKKKAVLVVVLALLLAFVVAMLMKPKQIETNPALNQNNEQMTDPVFDTAEDDVAPKNEIVKENTEDTAEMMEQMNKNMNLMMPIMTVSIALIAPLGLALYWFLSNILSIFERLFVYKFVKSEEE